MKPEDPFEKRLRRQPMRPVPATWREEILARADEAADAHRQRASFRPITFAAAAWVRLRELLWPCPQAWAGLAAAWIVIAALDLTLPGDAPGTWAHRAEPPSREMRQMLLQQRQMLAELSGTDGLTEAGSPGASAPQPRSQYHGHPRHA